MVHDFIKIRNLEDEEKYVYFIVWYILMVSPWDRKQVKFRIL